MNGKRAKAIRRVSGGSANIRTRMVEHEHTRFDQDGKPITRVTLKWHFGSQRHRYQKLKQKWKIKDGGETFNRWLELFNKVNLPQPQDV